jgi:regulation of enolase protein 1 (concanavalin A-like superfamily)
MSRIVILGLAVFSTLLGIAVSGKCRIAVAGHGYHSRGRGVTCDGRKTSRVQVCDDESAAHSDKVAPPSDPDAANEREEAVDLTDWGTLADPRKNSRANVKDGVLSMVVPGQSGFSIELKRMNAPRVLREVSGDFVATVKVEGDFAPGKQAFAERIAYNGAGLLLLRDELTYVRLDRGTLVRSGRQTHFTNFELRVDGKLERFGLPTDRPLLGDTATWLRLERRGNEIRGAVRQGDEDWTYLTPKKTALPDKLKIGVLGANSSNSPFSLRFSEFSVSAK